MSGPRRTSAPDELAPTGSPAATLEMFELVRRGMLVQAVAVAAKLGIADLLHESPKRADELADATGAHGPTLYRLLRTLAGLGLFVEDDEARFGLTPLGSALRSGEGSAREQALYFGEPFVWRAWENLRHSVMTGEPAFRHAHGMSLFEYLQRHPEADAVFHGWMTRQSKLQIPDILASYDFSRSRKVVDVGGGHGSLLAAILEASSALTGVLYDLPEVIEEGTLVEAAGLGERCEVIGGSFFDSVPPGGDCYLLKFVIHDWDDERAVQILRNVRAAIADNGRVLLLEFVIPPGNEYHHSKFLDLHLLVLTEGGRERTEAEYRELLQAAGFRLRRVLGTSSPLSILEGTPM